MNRMPLESFDSMVYLETLTIAASSGRQDEDDAILGRPQHLPENPAAERPVVFFLPGLGGEDDPELERFWEPSRKVLDLVPVTYLDWTEILRRGCDFAAIAEHVKHQIESKTSGGPVRMAGYSIGGHLAYATAMDFQAQGRQVLSMAILDAPASVSDFAPPLRNRLWTRIVGLFGFDQRSGLASLFAKILIREQSRPLLRSLVRYRNTRLPFRFETYLHHKISMQLVRRIFPRWWEGVTESATPLTTPTFLFRSEEHQPTDREDLGWGQYCLDLKIIPVVGTHRGMLDPERNGPLRAAFLDVMGIPPA